MNTNYRIIVAYYSREDDSLVGRYPLDMDESALRRLFARPRDEQMADCYPISEAHRSAIENAIKAELDLARYFYFVEFRAT